jgi:hypothetical protein
MTRLLRTELVRRWIAAREQSIATYRRWRHANAAQREGAEAEMSAADEAERTAAQRLREHDRMYHGHPGAPL